MSSPAPPAGESGGKKGMAKYVKRLKTVFKRSSPGRASTSGPSGTTTSKQSEIVSPPTPSVDQPALPSPPPVPPAPAEVQTAAAPTPNPTPPTETLMIDPFEKAKALFAKYGLTLDESEWPVANRRPVQRVYKPVRMRVRYTCHQCQTIFGRDKSCETCKHGRCHKCPRYPPKKRSKHKQAEQIPGDAATSAKLPADLEAAPMTVESSQPGPSHPSDPPHSPGGNRIIGEKVARSCHECNTLIQPGETDCANCHHSVCSKCPSEPAVTTPSLVEREWKKGRMRVRYICHQCQEVFHDKDKPCAMCKHARCEECPRDPPRKRRKSSPSDADVQGLEQRFAALEAERQASGEIDVTSN